MRRATPRRAHHGGAPSPHAQRQAWSPRRPERSLRPRVSSRDRFAVSPVQPSPPARRQQAFPPQSPSRRAWPRGLAFLSAIPCPSRSPSLACPSQRSRPHQRTREPLRAQIQSWIFDPQAWPPRRSTFLAHAWLLQRLFRGQLGRIQPRAPQRLWIPLRSPTRRASLLRGRHVVFPSPHSRRQAWSPRRPGRSPRRRVSKRVSQTRQTPRRAPRRTRLPAQPRIQRAPESPRLSFPVRRSSPSLVSQQPGFAPLPQRARRRVLPSRQASTRTRFWPAPRRHLW